MESTIKKDFLERIQEHLLQQTKDLIFILRDNNEFRIDFINKNQAKRILKVSQSQLVGESFLELIHKEDIDKFLNILNNGLLKTSKSLEIRLKKQKQEYFWCEISINRVDILGFDNIFIVARDIDKEKMFEKNLEEARARFRWISEYVPEIKYWRLLQPKKCVSAVQKSQEMLETVMDNIPHYVFWKDDNLNFLGCNKNFSELAGLTDPSEITGKTNKDLPLFRNYAKEFGRIEQEVVSSNKPSLKKNEIFILPNGEKLIFNVNRIPLSGDNDEVVGILSMYQDMTSSKLAEERLRASEKKYRNILENIKESYYEVDLRGNITFANDAFIDLLGYDGEEFIGINYKIFCDESTHKKIYNKFNYVYRTETSVKDFQYKAYDKEGKEVYVETSINLRYDSEGNKIGFSGLLREITEKYLLQQKLKKSEERYRLISENANDYITIINDQLKFEYINKQPYLMGLGYSKDDLIGQSCIDYLHPDDRKRAIKTLKFSFAKEKPGSQEVRFKHKSGKWIWLDVKGRIFNDTDNRSKALLISRDITERKRNEEKIKKSEEKLKKLNKLLEKKISERTKKLRESEEKFRTISEQSLLGITFIQDNTLIYANKALSSILGWEIEEMENLGMESIVESIHPKDKLKFMELVNETSKSSFGFTKQFSIRMITKSQQTKYLDVFIRRIKYQGKKAKLISIVDITDKKVAELKLRKSERELKLKNKELKKLDQLKTDFITMAAHELKTPLISISGYTDLILLREQKLKSEIREDLERILNNSKRLEEYINKLLDAMKIDAQKMDFNKQKTDIANIVKECVEDLKYQIQKKEISISFRLDNQIISRVDPFRLSQVFSNLVSNAIKFTQKGGNIRIIVERNDAEKILCCVKDNGIGLVESEIEKLFGKFVMLEKDIEKFSKGSGLGLYISKGIIEGHGGEIWAESQGKNLGSTFKFTLPVD
ncbi:MAG: putative Signal transduction histidine kinase [Promethearchaeota archaeon]|nr:MAG: putative Signal transduction histidine kinase [Candidatus Lokiarchaeota archaeon]